MFSSSAMEDHYDLDTGKGYRADGTGKDARITHLQQRLEAQAIQVRGMGGAQAIQVRGMGGAQVCTHELHYITLHNIYLFFLYSIGANRPPDVTSLINVYLTQFVKYVD